MFWIPFDLTSREDFNQHVLQNIILGFAKKLKSLSREVPL